MLPSFEIKPEQTTLPVKSVKLYLTPDAIPLIVNLYSIGFGKRKMDSFILDNLPLAIGRMLYVTTSFENLALTELSEDAN